MIAMNPSYGQKTFGFIADKMASRKSAYKKQTTERRADYNYPKQSRFNRQRTGIATQGSSGDYHIRNEAEFYRGLETIRDMDRNDAIIGQMGDRATDNIVQDGFALDVKTGDKILDKDLKDRFCEETMDAMQLDVANEKCWHDFEWFACRGMLMDGDCGIAALPVEDKLQFFEAHNIYHEERSTNNNIVCGVETNDFGERTRYHIAIDDPNPNRITRYHSIPLETFSDRGVRQFFHVYKNKRSSLRRGISCVAPIMEISGMFEDVNFAKLVQQQMASCIAILRSKDKDFAGSGFPSSGGGESRTGDGYTETTKSGSSRLIENWEPGMEVEALPGETLTGFSPDLPGAGYIEQATLLMRMMAINFGLPLMVAMLDGSDSTFHGYRGALLEARQGFERSQAQLIKRLHRPFYIWKINQWLRDDPALWAAERNSKVDIFCHEWAGPGFPYVEPLKDAQAEAFQMRNGLNSPRRIQAGHNRDHKEIVQEITDDQGYAIERAIEKATDLNKRLKPTVPVHWRDIANLPAPEGVNVSQNVDDRMDVNQRGDETQRNRQQGGVQ